MKPKKTFSTTLKFIRSNGTRQKCGVPGWDSMKEANDWLKKWRESHKNTTYLGAVIVGKGKNGEQKIERIDF